jgi:hypothetical protein
LAFSIAEQEYLLGVPDSERFADTAPMTVYATWLDEGHHHGSVHAMYRLLVTHSQVGPTILQFALPYLSTRHRGYCAFCLRIGDHLNYF